MKNGSKSRSCAPEAISLKKKQRTAGAGLPQFGDLLQVLLVRVLDEAAVCLERFTTTLTNEWRNLGVGVTNNVVGDQNLRNFRSRAP